MVGVWIGLGLGFGLMVLGFTTRHLYTWWMKRRTAEATKHTCTPVVHEGACWVSMDVSNTQGGMVVSPPVVREFLQGGPEQAPSRSITPRPYLKAISNDSEITETTQTLESDDFLEEVTHVNPSKDRLN